MGEAIQEGMKFTQEGGKMFGMGEAAELAAELPIKGPDQEGMKFTQEGGKMFGMGEAAELAAELPIKGPDQEGMKFTQEGGKSLACTRPSSSPPNSSSRKPQQRGMKFFEMKFDGIKAELSLEAHHQDEVRCKESRAPPQAHRQGSPDKEAESSPVRREESGAPS
ncbi:hypothetical protein COCNU_07G012120 [Cocos nucifera]|uniref:Uncharacterized protein n=1 Tax=Cocos nucifera TaxID=13894 RepID=A0A8K0N4T8_COCNU|nr:hypothetical protein COCNU_07G012120 [Cocos nucifera]